MASIKKERGLSERIPTYPWELDGYVNTLEKRFTYLVEINTEIEKVDSKLKEIPDIWKSLNRWSRLELFNVVYSQEEFLRQKQNQLQALKYELDSSLGRTQVELKLAIGNIIASYNEIMNDFNKKYILEGEMIQHLAKIKAAVDLEPEGITFFEREMLKPVFESFKKYLSLEKLAA